MYIDRGQELKAMRVKLGNDETRAIGGHGGGARYERDKRRLHTHHVWSGVVRVLMHDSSKN